MKTREQVLVARTGPITLEDVSLGPFAIELHLDRLAGRRTPDAACFDCVALESKPAATDDAVTHPHVKGKTLCAGDATVPLTAALRAGRLADAFLLIRGVLQTYNPASAYVSLRDWGGSSCGECGRSVGPDDTFYCEQCHRDVCDDCFTVLRRLRPRPVPGVPGRRQRLGPALLPRLPPRVPRLPAHRGPQELRRRQQPVPRVPGPGRGTDHNF